MCAWMSRTACDVLYVANSGQQNDFKAALPPLERALVIKVKSLVSFPSLEHDVMLAPGTRA